VSQLSDSSIAVQYFLHAAELGEGTNRDNPLQEISMDVVITDKRVFEEASTEVEVLSENPAVTDALLHAVRNYRQLELSPDVDTFRRWYDPPWRTSKPFPKFIIVPPDEVPRFRIAVLRTSIRCLRLMMFCQDGKRQLEEAGGPVALNQAVVENPLDDFVKNDVKAIFSAVYGGDNAVRRIAISNVPIVVEMMKENHDSAIVQLAGVRRICSLLADVQARQYSPSHSPTRPAQHTNSGNQADDPGSGNAAELERLALLAELDAFAVAPLVTETLSRYDVDKYLSLYVHVCRFISFVAIEGTQHLKAPREPQTGSSPVLRPSLLAAMCRAECQAGGANGRHRRLHPLAVQGARDAAREEGRRKS
jgi:hypothetical protein